MAHVKRQAENAGGSLRVTNEMDEAFDGAQVIYAKSWGSRRFYGAPEKDMEERAAYRAQWIVDERRMARTSDALFMHCLPVRRGVIVTDGVINSARSVVIDEAENRLHIQKAIMARLLGGEAG
jgi:N-acetylornithine carbamoyltransferase